LSTKKPPKSKRLRDQDPFLEREGGQYANPLPSREFVLQVLESEGVPLTDARLIELFDVAPWEIEGFTRRLGAMERDGQVMRNRKGAVCMAEKLHLIKGRVQGHVDGFGFLIPEDGSPDMFLGPKEMQKAFHGDTAMGRQIGLDRRGRPEAAIVEVLERGNRKVVGRLFELRGLYFVVAEEKRISQDILIPPADLGNARAGQVVVAEIVIQPSRQAEPIGRIVEVLGNYGESGMEIEIALRKHDLPHEFSPSAERSRPPSCPRRFARLT
jgi:ribonuclease R